MCRLQKFLCCFELETGGLVIGWLNLICSLLVVIFQVLALLGAINDNCPEGAQTNECKFGNGLSIIILVFAIVSALISYLLICGVNAVSFFRRIIFLITPNLISQRNAKYILIVLVVYVIEWVLSVISVIAGDRSTISVIIIVPYCLLILYSLFEKFSE
jgi:hypothetical protein